MSLLLSFKLDLSRGCYYRGEHQRHKGVGSSDGQLHCHVLNVQIWVDMLWQRKTRKQVLQAL